ncbi:GNAT family N-acetyltransferase [Devosia sp.]|uniref:bifunctional acetate--CoA ligase family protein/GNAT family N-acetyltransferase n=1 Tax=Devosia sp. TaxID=1871048 RepID=UPI003A9000F8
MTLRNLDLAFRPRSVAVIGASTRAGAVGHVVMRNIIDGGFTGPAYPVNPKYAEVHGLPCYRRIADLPAAPDLAVIMTPPATVPGIIAELGAVGCKAAVVITAGISGELRQQMLDAARPHLLRIIGPNTIGLLAPTVSLNASFVHLTPLRGRLGLISQSGAIVSSLVDWAVAESIGFSQLLSLGDMTDVDVGDCLDMLAADPETSAILIYLESITEARKFMSAARAASRVKPVIAVKPGRHQEAAQAAQTHTGALAGADRVVEAALRRAGVIRVDDLEDLFNAAEITARFKPLHSGRTAIVTNGGGAGVLAVDHLIDEHATMAELAPETIAALDKVLPGAWSRANPVDIIGDAPPERYCAAIEAVAADPGVDALLVMNCPTALASSRDAAEGVAALATKGLVNGKPMLTCWLGKQHADGARDLFHSHGIASFDTPIQAARAVALLTKWSKLRASLQRVPAIRPDFHVDRAAARKMIDVAAEDHRTLLTEPEAKAVLAAYGIPVPETLSCRDEAEVSAAATELLSEHKAVVLKLLSRTITHKSDVGGVVLNLATPAAAAEAATKMRDAILAADPDAQIDGFTVQPMIRRPHAQELIAGLSVDPVFGPTILFGAGGTSVEVVDDTATGLVPLDTVLAGELINRTRVGKLLAGYRDVKPANRRAILRSLVSLSQLAIDCPAITGIDINPLLADEDGVVALDARIEIDPARVGQTGLRADLAIRPYPSEAEAHVSPGGRDVLIRPIRPYDSRLYPDFMARTNREDLRLRFLSAITNLTDDMMVRFTQLDYDREMAFIAVDEATDELMGMARYSADPDRIKAEFGVLVRSDLKGIGLGATLLQHLIDHARTEGIGALEGIVLRENARMLRLAHELGFIEDRADEPGLVRVVLPLAETS